jgi:arylsulfatase A-like enzyme
MRIAAVLARFTSTPPIWLPRALAIALPFAAALTILSELVVVVVAAPAPTAFFVFGVLGELTVALFTVSWPLIVITVAEVAVLYGMTKRPTHRLRDVALLLTLSTLGGAVALYFLVRNTEIGDRGWLFIVPMGFGLAQGASFAFLAGRPKTRRIAISLFALAPPVLFTANYELTRSFYLPTEALFFTAVVTAAALFASTSARARGVWLSGGVIVVAGAIAVAFPAARSSAFALTYLHSALGRAAGMTAAVVREGERLRPELARERTLTPRVDGLALFERYSGLPPLPTGLSLEEHDVVFVLVESFRYDETSLEDSTDTTTPTLSAIAQEGLTFRRATSPSNATFPSLTALLSLTTPSFTPNDVPPAYWTGVLRQESPTAPDAFRAAGFETFWVGHDFQGVFGTALRGIRRRFDEVELIEIPHDAPSPNDSDIVDAAIDTVRVRRARDERFFGLVFLAATHDAYRVHDPEAPSERPIDLYRQELRYVDGQIGRLVDALDGGEGEDSDDRTILIVSGDHGEAFGEHGYSHHSTTVHRAQTHVPFLMRVPGLAPAVIDTPTSNTYALPWLLRSGPSAAREIAEKVIAEDLGPLMHAAGGAALVEMVSPRYQLTALRYADYTVIYDLYGDVAQIFDATSDPDEEHDLAPLEPALRARFQPLLDGYRRARFDGQRFLFTPSVR